MYRRRFWRADSLWDFHGDRLEAEREVAAELAQRSYAQQWDEHGGNWEDGTTPFRPARRVPLNEWDSTDEEHLVGLIARPHPEEVHIETEEDMARLTKERREILVALEKAGGKIHDPGGFATNKLALAAGRPGTQRSFNGTLSRMEEEGFIVREVNGRRTYTISIGEDAHHLLSGAPMVGDAPAQATEVPVSTLVETLQVLGGEVEDSEGRASKLLRDIMKWDQSDSAFRKMLHEAEKDGIIARQIGTGNRVFKIFLTSAAPFVEPKATSVFASTPVDTEEWNGLQLSRRAYNCLDRSNIKTIDDLCAQTEEDLMRIPNLGVNSVGNIKVALAGIGRSLTYPTSVLDPDVEAKIDTMIQEVREMPEPGQYGYEEPDTPQPNMTEAQATAMFLLEEVIRRASAPLVDESAIDQAVAPWREKAEQQAKDLAKAAKTLTDRMNKLDEAEHKIKELEVELVARQNDINTLKKENTAVRRELARRPIGPKVEDILSIDSMKQLNELKKVMQEKPRPGK